MIFFYCNIIFCNDIKIVYNISNFFNSYFIYGILLKYKIGNYFVLNNCILYRVLFIIFWFFYNYVIYKNIVILKFKLLI